MKQLYVWGLLYMSTMAMAQQDLNVSVIETETSEPIPNIDIKLTNQTRGISIVQQTNAQEETFI